MPHQKRRHTSGYTLLLAVLISSLLLTVALSVFSLSSKEVILSSSSRESQFAFYAADAGMECALYWDFKFVGGDPLVRSVFPTSSDSTLLPSGSSIDCVNNDISSNWGYTPPLPTGDEATTTFSLNLGDPTTDNDECVIVTVAKFGSPTRTKVEARGRNSCDTTNPRRVERALRAIY
jgi:hypothetical protein